MLWSSVLNLITYKPASAQTVHGCEEYKRTDVENYFKELPNIFYHVVPDISGSYGGFFNPRIQLATCFVPVTSRKCFYWDRSKEKWRPCGQDFQHLDPNDPFRLKYSSDGGVLERNAKKYHGFLPQSKFYFD
ncbi:MAG: hypothetical protein O4861_00805 [Trichodesmium sp. St16_bin4-tuft]|nr:hypothetical protein [Trichodesmium sp. St4_bin8_1]MDE5074238.1 hypothetical protein [Trichodesmium sp. St5_bin8]MDE5076850.1 hypothetical protein [Trichodesmium sp. St2_bin6]MDE5096954.1 hypothetical protein [Trichodesmium sp. St16_bin4-tuft]MDE5101834.1 hypothetical protein [Trichodesmium sp. St19_bin2]